MSIDRVMAKVNQAKGSLQRQATAIERQADEVLAREQHVAGRIDGAFAPHIEGLRHAASGLDEMERALDLMSNGMPPGEPSQASESGGVAGPEEGTVAPLPPALPAS